MITLNEHLAAQPARHRRCRVCQLDSDLQDQLANRGDISIPMCAQWLRSLGYDVTRRAIRWHTSGHAD